MTIINKSSIQQQLNSITKSEVKIMVQYGKSYSERIDDLRMNYDLNQRVLKLGEKL